MDAARLRSWLDDAGKAAGFADIFVTDARLGDRSGKGLDAFLADQFEGDMAWLRDTAARRRQPAAMWDGARTAIVAVMNYGPDHDPMDNLAATAHGNVSVYARGRDYHDVIKGKLKQLAGQFAARSGAAVKVFVDTAPLMEKPLAARAGAGWQGKHTNLVSRDHGSWLFLGTILTDAELTPDMPEQDHCGTCTRCLDVCPTDAFPAPYRLDARRCISYLTIEHKGTIPTEFRAAMGNHIYGCDDCLAVCPWNKFAQTAHETKLALRADLKLPDLDMLVQLDDRAFRDHFSGSPIKRTGRDRFVRNVLIAVGNMEALSDTMRARVEACLDDAAPAVRAMAIWALARHDLPRARHFAETRLADETDDAVRDEWLAVRL